MSEKTYLSWTECFCPLCEKTHRLEIYWTGKNKPKKFCKKCKHKAGTIDGTYIYIEKPEIERNNNSNSNENKE